LLSVDSAVTRADVYCNSGIFIVRQQLPVLMVSLVPVLNIPPAFVRQHRASP
jgi:hypothetical protein